MGCGLLKRVNDLVEVINCQGTFAHSGYTPHSHTTLRSLPGSSFFNIGEGSFELLRDAGDSRIDHTGIKKEDAGLKNRAQDSTKSKDQDSKAGSWSMLKP